MELVVGVLFFFKRRRRHTRCSRDWSSDVCSSDLPDAAFVEFTCVTHIGAVHATRDAFTTTTTISEHSKITWLNACYTLTNLNYLPKHFVSNYELITTVWSKGPTSSDLFPICTTYSNTSHLNLDLIWRYDCRFLTILEFNCSCPRDYSDCFHLSLLNIRYFSFVSYQIRLITLSFRYCRSGFQPRSIRAKMALLRYLYCILIMRIWNHGFSCTYPSNFDSV